MPGKLMGRQYHRTIVGYWHSIHDADGVGGTLQLSAQRINGGTIRIDAQLQALLPSGMRGFHN